ncbi:MAG TPA: hypothetical protein VID47_14425, partial [Actinomycetota bacterium]
MGKRRWMWTGVAVALIVGFTAGAATAKFSFGVWRDQQLALQAPSLFGVDKPLAQSSSKQISQAQAQANPLKLAKLAKGLEARVVTTQGPAVDDQISLWPDDKNPTWLIACNEDGTSDPGLVRIELSTGDVFPIVTGTEDCDPTRRTPWGTIVFGEEDGTSGQMYELIDPVHTTAVTLDRTTGQFSGGVGASNLVRRDALGRAAFEGLAILPDGTTYLDADDSGLGPKNGGPGNAFYKFVPTTPFTGTAPITDLSQSPYAAGSVYGLRVGLGTNYGQGREFGFGQWVALAGGPNPDLEDQGVAAGVTGYYRTEDNDLDPAALKKGNVRVCSPATGDESNHLYGEVVCFTDGTVADAEANTSQPEMQPFVFGGTSEGINMPDNIDFQPGTNNVVLNEDAETDFEFDHNNDIWDCLPDGPDQDLLSDGCARVATLNDLTSEWTGGIFDAT